MAVPVRSEALSGSLLAEALGRAPETEQAVAAAEQLEGPTGGAQSPEHRNEVLLVGRVSSEPVERELPSGDRLLAWRVVVDRPPLRRPPPAGVRPATIDTVDCVAWTTSTRRTARGLRAGDVVQISGSLRRRFYRAGAAPTSRTEVAVAAVRRLRRA